MTLTFLAWSPGRMRLPLTKMQKRVGERFFFVFMLLRNREEHFKKYITLEVLQKNNCDWKYGSGTQGILQM